MKIYTGYFRQAGRYRENGLCTISVAIGNCKFFSPDAKLLELCPTFDMLRNDYDEKEYQIRILNKTSVKQVCERIALLAKGRDAVLLCFESDPMQCHRSFIANWMNKSGIEVIEYPIVAKAVNDQKPEPKKRSDQGTQINLF